ncbi:MAG: DEAD/DEAH box helicase family protein, partial [Stellaceae bacterium]
MPDRHASSAAAVPDCDRDQTIACASDSDVIGRVRVLLPLPLPEPLDYLVPRGIAPPAPGCFVRVPLGGRSLVGVAWDGAGGELAADRLKSIDETLPVRPLTPDLRRFVERVAAYTMSSPGAVLRMAMSIPEALQPPRPRRLCTASAAGLAALADPEAPARLTPARRRVLGVLRDAPLLPATEAARLAGCGAGVVRELAANGLIEERLVAAEPAAAQAPDWRRPAPEFSPDQASAAQRLVDRVETGGFGVTLLDGVTGSGKTETYFAAIAAALAAGHQVLVLLPEIALGAQWLQRFRDRFGVPPTQWHSE